MQQLLLLSSSRPHNLLNIYLDKLDHGLCVETGVALKTPDELNKHGEVDAKHVRNYAHKHSRIYTERSMSQFGI
jgi:hypothetical protein